MFVISSMSPRAKGVQLCFLTITHGSVFSQESTVFKSLALLFVVFGLKIQMPLYLPRTES